MANFLHGQVDQCTKPWTRAVSLTLTSVSGFLFDYSFSRNTGRWSNLPVTVASHPVWLLLFSDPSICLRQRLDVHLHLADGFRFPDATEPGDFPLSTAVDVSKPPSILDPRPTLSGSGEQVSEPLLCIRQPVSGQKVL